jgi:hypothetical protein
MSAAAIENRIDAAFRSRHGIGMADGPGQERT